MNYGSNPNWNGTYRKDPHGESTRSTERTLLPCRFFTLSDLQRHPWTGEQRHQIGVLLYKSFSMAHDLPFSKPAKALEHSRSESVDLMRVMLDMIYDLRPSLHLAGEPVERKGDSISLRGLILLSEDSGEGSAISGLLSFIKINNELVLLSPPALDVPNPADAAKARELIYSYMYEELSGGHLDDPFNPGPVLIQYHANRIKSRFSHGSAAWLPLAEEKQA